ncbi:MAG: oligoendopeptidase F family protein [Bacilli bacterium]|nr:oligoendopeptidase F family protein [Bacilli bacterium]
MKQHDEISEIVSELYKNKLKIEIKLSRLKNYKSLIEESMDEYEIEKTFFNMVIEEISKKSEVKQKYNKLKKEALSLNQFNNYDTLLSICDIPKINIEIEEGIKAIKKALAILGETYTKLIDEMFENGWAHAYPQENKIGGSHSSIAYDGVPYILVNYTGTITSLRLLAHEIGHAVNTHYSKQENGYLDFSVTYFLTEVASKVNEILLNKSLIENATNGEEKIYILNDNINAIINSIFNQAMISEFENEIIKQIENQQEIESEEINKIYLKLVEKYNGEQLTINEKMKYEWIKISHLIMQNSYYVYQYSVGACLSIYIVKKLLKDKEFKEKYIKFLSLGNSKSIEEILSTLDIDIANYNFIDYGIEYVNELLEELQKLLKEKEQKRIKSLII